MQYPLLLVFPNSQFNCGSALKMLFGPMVPLTIQWLWAIVVIVNAANISLALVGALLVLQKVLWVSLHLLGQP